MNLSELAQLLNLSPSTVSRVLNGTAQQHRISAQTVTRVQQAANRLHVTPDPLGASLRRGKPGMAGLLVPDITNPFFSGLARAIELELRGRGMTVQLCDSAEDAAAEREILQQILGRRLDGLILAPVGKRSGELVQAICSASFPVVVIDRVLPGLGLPSVSIDNAEAGRKAAECLIEAGHRNIGCLRGDHESFTDGERHRGVVEALSDAGLPVHSAWFSGTGYSRESGLQGARSILSAASPPSGIVTLNGQGILGLLQAASELGFSIPDDLSVVAFDEQPWSALMKPPLTTVVQPIEAMARRAVNLLLDAGGGAAGEAVGARLPAQIRARDSVKRLTAMPRAEAPGSTPRFPPDPPVGTMPVSGCRG